MSRTAPANTGKARKAVEVRAPGGGGKRGPRLDDMAGATGWLLNRVDVERMNPTRIDADTLKLGRMHALADLLDNPHRAVRTVHVAGTKGKGSTCEMTAASLEACGYTVGVYTSPHLIDVRERIRINRRAIGEAAFVQAVQRVADAAANLPEKDGEPTFFELLTAAAFVYFAEQAVDVAVIETGLGGRLDSTNIVAPEVTAITSISLDHTQILGDTVEKIAREKAGIFKAGVPAVSAPQAEGVAAALRESAGEIGAPFGLVGQELDITWRFDAKSNIGPHHRISLSSPRNEFEHLLVPLRGEHQAHNCAVALAILDKMCERGFKTPAAKVTRGLNTVQMPGRLEKVWDQPRIVADGAHNAESMRCLFKALSAHTTYDSLVVVFGCAADKDIAGMLHEVGHSADKVIFTQTRGNARACDPADLQRRLGDEQRMSQTAPDIGEAIRLAARAVGRDDLILVTGSLHLVGDAKKHLAELAARKSGV